MEHVFSLSCLLAAFLFLSVDACAESLRAPANLRCEYLANPSAVDVPLPRLSWEASDSRRGARQTAYRIVAASTKEELIAENYDLWDSGKVFSPASCQVLYEGKRPDYGRKCWWRLQTWDANGQASPWSQPAYWQSGLPENRWQAHWIGDATEAPPVQQAHNGYHSGISPTPDAEKWVGVDLGTAHDINAVKLYPARPFDWKDDVPGFLFPVRFRIEIADDPSFQNAKTVVDRTAADVENPGDKPLELKFVSVNARCVRIVVTRLRERDPGNCAFTLAEMQVLSGDEDVALHASVVALDSTDSGAWSQKNLTDGDLVSHKAGGADALPAPMLRKKFSIVEPVKRATVWTTALGLYELHINGKRVGDHLLAPEWTDYTQKVQYQAFDVTDLVKSGENAVGVQLGDGWYAGRIGMSDGLIGKKRGVYGRKPLFMMRLEIETADGRKQDVVSDGSWVSTLEGPIRSSDILDGEVYDATKEKPGWDRPGYKSTGWHPVELIDEPHIRVVAQPNEPIRIVQELKPIAITEPKPGVYIFDLGQNMVGHARLKLRGQQGEKLTFRHGEWLNDDGTLYTENLRGAPQTDTYVCRAGEQIYEPHFTYHGFRYFEATGLPSKPNLTDLTGVVFNSSSPQVGSFDCSDPLVAKLWKNIYWTQRANMMSVPTDCPQRDERLGWMGDIQAFSQTAIYNMDMAGFFTKWVPDIRDGQADDGRFPDFAPQPYGRNRQFTGVPAWGDAGTIVPWRCWQNYADERMIREQFDAARRWIAYIKDRNPDLIWNNARGNDYNDWLNGDTLIAPGWPQTGGTVPNDVFATAFFAHSTEIIAKMAAVLGDKQEADKYAKLFDDIKTAFNAAFVDADGLIKGDTQAGYALALNFNLLPDSVQPKAFDHMLKAIDRYHTHISTGIQTTHRMMMELTRRGRSDIAYKLLLNRDFPSWLYSIENGATTIWERWDGYVKGRGFQNPGMNSFNHWAIGAVGEWMDRAMVGINPDEDHPGWQHFIIHPQVGGGISWVKGEYHSIRGRIAVSWQNGPSGLSMDVTIPANTLATVFVPAKDASKVREGGKIASTATGLKYLGMEDGCAAFEAQAGSYKFEVK